MSRKARRFKGLKEVVVIDVETTGLSPDENRIIQVAAIKTRLDEYVGRGRKKTETFECLLNPGVKLDRKIRKITGKKDSDLVDRPSFSDIARELRDFIGSASVVAHNVDFDSKFLNAEFARAGVEELPGKGYCTMKRTASIYDGKWPKLEEAAKYFKVPGREGSNHDAFEDTRIAFDIAVCLYELDNDMPSTNRHKSYWKQQAKLRWYHWVIAWILVLWFITAADS